MSDPSQTEPKIQRKLAALFAADVADYSRLMSVDEEGTTKTLSEYRLIMDELIAKYGGRIANTAGDSVLAEFASSVEAVRCAVEIQESLLSRSSTCPPNRRIEFRIGVNIGDVIQKDGDLLGDGVNVAARLESIAVPGGICISGEVRDQIEGKLTLQCVSMGQQRLKNINRPIRAYKIGAGNVPRFHDFFRLQSDRLFKASIAMFVGLILLGLLWFYFERMAPSLKSTSTEQLERTRSELERRVAEERTNTSLESNEILRRATFGGHNYLVVRTWGGTWEEAEASARAMGGYLVAINSPEENAFVLGLIQDEDSLWINYKNSNMLGPWIGLVQREGAVEPDGGWVWSNGDAITYSNWLEYQPNNWKGKENVGHFNEWIGHGPPRWGDTSELGNKRGFIAEFEDE